MNGGATKAGSRTAVGVGLLALALAGSAGHAGALTSPGCLDGGGSAVVAGLEPDLDLRLADGRLVRLAGIDPGPGAIATARDRLSTWLAGRTVRVVALGAAPDRWGRTPAVVFASQGADDAPVSVGEALLEAGLARARPNLAIAPCWPLYLRLEAAARDARRGLWSDPASVIDTSDAAALRSRTGDFVVVEGLVESLHEGRARTYLRFAGPLAASIERRAVLRFAKAGADPAAWLHRRVRLRGFLDDRWGLQIEIATPEQIEAIGP